MTDVMQSYNYNTLYAYQQQARLQGFGANQGYGGETAGATETAANPPVLSNGSHEIPQIRGHVNVSMAHLQQQQEMNVPKLEVDSMSAVPTSQAALDQSHQMNYHPQQPQQPGPATQQQQPAPSSETMNIKKFYENDDEDTVIDEHFTKSFSPESRARLRQPTFPASFYTQSASPQRSSSTSGYNGSLPGSVSPSSNPYAQAFPNQAVSQLYQQAAAQNSFSHHHTTTSPLATTNNGTTTSTEWPYSQYQQAFGHQSNPYQSTNTTAQTSAAPTSSIHSAHHYNQLAVNYPFSQQQEQHHRTPAFATGFPQY